MVAGSGNICRIVQSASNHVSLLAPLLYILLQFDTLIRDELREKTPWRREAIIAASCPPWRCRLCGAQWPRGYQLLWIRHWREGPLLATVCISPWPKVSLYQSPDHENSNRGSLLQMDGHLSCVTPRAGCLALTGVSTAICVNACFLGCV